MNEDSTIFLQCNDEIANINQRSVIVIFLHQWAEHNPTSTCIILYHPSHSTIAFCFGDGMGLG
jgi:hypothetical protein